MDPGYGIALNDGWIETRKARLAELDQIEAGLDRGYAQHFPKFTRESVGIDENLAYILKKVFFRR